MRTGCRLPRLGAKPPPAYRNSIQKSLLALSSKCPHLRTSEGARERVFLRSSSYLVLSQLLHFAGWNFLAPLNFARNLDSEVLTVVSLLIDSGKFDRFWTKLELVGGP